MLDAPLLLLTEDDPLIADVLEAALSEKGFGLVVARDGSAALAELDDDASRFSCIVTDVHLGSGPTGWDVARRARELVAEVPVIYTSGHRGGEWAANGVPHSLMIEKPFVPSQVITAVSMLLSKR